MASAMTMPVNDCEVNKVRRMQRASLTGSNISVCVNYRGTSLGWELVDINLSVVRVSVDRHLFVPCYSPLRNQWC